MLFFNNQKLTSISFIIFFIWMKLFWTISKNCWTPELGQNWEFHLFPLFLFAQETMSAPTFFLRLLFPPLAYFFLSSFNTFRFLCFYQSGIAVSVFSTMNVFSCPNSSILGGGGVRAHAGFPKKFSAGFTSPHPCIESTLHTLNTWVVWGENRLKS